MKSKNVPPAFVLILIILLTLISCKIIALCLNITTIEKSHLTYDMLNDMGIPRIFYHSIPFYESKR